MEITHQQLTIKDIILGLVTLIGIIVVSVSLTFYGYSIVLKTFADYIHGYISVTSFVNLLESISRLFTIMPGLAWFILLQGLDLAIGVMVSIANNY